MTDVAVRRSENADPPGPGHAVVAIDGVSHAFPSAAGQRPTLVLDDVSLDLPEGQFVALVGRSGCGKTTLLNMAAGLLSPTIGSIRINGRPVTGPSRQTGYMFARDGLLPWRTSRRNVEAGLELRGIGRSERRQRAVDMLARVGLAGNENSYPSQLSHGMRQRVALARTLVLDPDILLMDEPFAALDAQTKIALQVEFARIWEGTGKTVMFVTHDLNEAVVMADKVVVLASNPGRIHEVIDIDLPRPRDTEALRYTDDYQHLNRRVWESLRDAASAATDGDSDD